MKNVPERIADLRRAMAEAGCQYFVMTSSDPHGSEFAPAHFTSWVYFSGFSCENAMLIVAADKAALWVDGRFFGAADKALAGTGVESMHKGVKGVPMPEEWLTMNVRKGEVVGYDATCMPVNTARELAASIEGVGGELRYLPLVDKAWTEDRPALPSTPAWLLDKKFVGYTAAEKLEMLRAELRKQGCTAQLLTTLDSIGWLFNLRAMDVECTPLALAFAYVDMKKAVIFMDTARLAPEAARELKAAGVEFADYNGAESFLKQNAAEETILLNPAKLNAALDMAVRGNSKYTVREAEDPITMMKGVKNDTELAVTKAAHIRDGAAMCRFQMELEKRMAAGENLRETDVDTILHKYRSAGENFIIESFGTIAGMGTNAAMMHYSAKPGADSPLERRGMLLVDSGATYYDGTTDITRTYAMGPLTEEEKQGYTYVLRCHIDMAMAIWLEGRTGAELDMYARQPMWRHMLDYRCGTGHGVGHVSCVHEGPHKLRPFNNVVFVPGMVITDEPGIYTEGSLGVRIENELVCVEAGESEYGRFLKFEPLMWVPIDLKPALLDQLTAEEKEWLNWYHAETYKRVSPLLNAEEQAWLKDKCAAV